MSLDTQVAPSLFDLLARTWTLPGPVEAVCFNRDGGAVAFAGGGALAIAPIADPERPETRMRQAADTGRQTILPRKTPARPAAMVEGVAGPVAPYGGKSFVTGGGGGLVSVTPRGQSVALPIALDGPVTALARDPVSAAVAVGAGAALVVLPDDADDAPLRLAPGAPVTALAFAPTGHGLAVGHAGGVSFWSDGARTGEAALDRAPLVLSWSPDGSMLACGFAAPGFALIHVADLGVETNSDYPTAVASFGWSGPAAAFATSGAFRAIAWSLTADGLADPIPAGRNGLVIVERVAASPDRPLLAAGYANGLLCLNQIGGREEMLLRVSGAAITALAWSADGAHLAVGDAAGEAALISFPPNLFK